MKGCTDTTSARNIRHNNEEETCFNTTATSHWKQTQNSNGRVGKTNEENRWKLENTSPILAGTVHTQRMIIYTASAPTVDFSSILNINFQI